MSDPESKPSPSTAQIPSWQRDDDTAPSSQDDEPSDPKDSASSADSQPPQDQLEVAKRFLQDEKVKDAPTQQKMEFLKAKGVEDGDIQKLLGETSTPSSTASPAPSPSSPPTPSSQTSTTAAEPHFPPSDRAPIVTYPEFLTKPARPPPLLDQSTIFSLLSTFAGLSTFLYGTTHFLVNPMIESQTDARHDFHASAATRLTSLITKLEGTVSEIPVSVSFSRRRNNEAGHDDQDQASESSEAEDPSEMFHRDIGTQTSPAEQAALSSSPSASSRAFDGSSSLLAATESPSRQQASNLTTLNQRLASLRDDIKGQTRDMEDLKAVLDVFRDDLDSMTYTPADNLVGGFDMYRLNKGQEQVKDEIRNVRDSIRRVKGVLLSTRNFPSSVR